MSPSRRGGASPRRPAFVCSNSAINHGLPDPSLQNGRHSVLTGSGSSPSRRGITSCQGLSKEMAADPSRLLKSKVTLPINIRASIQSENGRHLTFAGGGTSPSRIDSSRKAFACHGDRRKGSSNEVEADRCRSPKTKVSSPTNVRASMQSKVSSPTNLRVSMQSKLSSASNLRASMQSKVPSPINLRASMQSEVSSPSNFRASVQSMYKAVSSDTKHATIHKRSPHVGSSHRDSLKGFQFLSMDFDHR